MTLQRIDGVRLRQAIQEFGSLQKAVDILKNQKKTLEADVSSLKREIDTRQKKLVEYREKLASIEQTIRGKTGFLIKLKDDISKYGLQFEFFKSFLAMLLTSPSRDENVEDLATYILMAAEIYERSSLPDKCRRLFVDTVLGKFLHSYRCYHCEAKFIVNKKPRDWLTSFQCPVCGSSSSVIADDGFLEAMLGSSKSDDANKAPEQDKQPLP